MLEAGIPGSFARRYLARDSGIQAIGIGPKRQGGRSTDRLALIFFVRRKLKHPSAKHPSLPTEVRLRSARRWGPLAERTLQTDVVEVRGLRPYALSVADGIRHPRKRARSSSSLAALLEVSPQAAPRWVGALTSAHGVSSQNRLHPERLCKFRSRSSGVDVLGRVELALLPRRRGTRVDAALATTAAALTSPLDKGSATMGPGGSVHFLQVPEPRPRRSYRARPPSNAGRVTRRIRCLATGAVVRNVAVPGLGNSLYRNQVLTTARLVPGDSGTLLLDDDNLPVAMLNGGSERQTASGRLEPVNFFSPMRDVLRALLIEGVTRVRLVGGGPAP